MSEERPRVFFADDDPDILELFSIVAARNGWDCVTAKTAEEILEKVNESCTEGGRCFDIIVTDVHFFQPGQSVQITGMAAARVVRERFPNLPILFLTGYGGPLTEENVASVGKAELMVKPAPLEMLIQRINLLLDWSVQQYRGPERRRTSINRTGEMRRGTDVKLRTPRILEMAISAVQRAREA